MKAIFLLLLLLVPASLLRAEGIASYTIVTTNNRNVLHGHTLELNASAGDKPYVEIVIRPAEVRGCRVEVVLYDATGKKPLMMINPAIMRVNAEGELSEGVRAGFYLSEDMLDLCEIRYHLPADEKNRINVFQISQGSLRRLGRSL